MRAATGAQVPAFDPTVMKKKKKVRETTRRAAASTASRKPSAPGFWARTRDAAGAAAPWTRRIAAVGCTLLATGWLGAAPGLVARARCAICAARHAHALGLRPPFPPLLSLTRGAFGPQKPVEGADAGGDAAADEVAEQVEDLACACGAVVAAFCTLPAFIRTPPRTVDDLGFGKKKKKKKPKAEGEEGAEGDGAPGGADAAGDEGDELGELKLKKKKKKKATPDDDELGGGGDGEEGAGGEGEDAGPGAGLPWANSTRDYHYEELLGRVFGILRAHNPELAGEKHKTILKPPQVLREGTKKTVFVNFSELCKAMHRAPDHVIAYLLAELGTSGSLDGQARLIVKGRFLPKVFEGILRRYINDYVICNMCKSADTLLHKENRLYILRCQAVRWLRLAFLCRAVTHALGLLPHLWYSAAHRAPCQPSSRASWRAWGAARLRREDRP